MAIFNFQIRGEISIKEKLKMKNKKVFAAIAATVITA